MIRISKRMDMEQKGCVARRLRWVGAIVLALLMTPIHNAAFAQETAALLRRGYFREITDAASRGYTIQGFRMSRDGSRAVFSVTRDGTFVWELRTILTDGTQEVLIEEGETTPSNSDFKAFDISDDGSRIAYVHLNVPEIMVYDVATSTSTSILATVPFTNFGVTSPAAIDPRDELAFFRMTGDGSGVYFLNAFGPNGGGTPDDPPRSGQTIYRVTSDGSSVQAVFSTAEIQSVPNISPTASIMVPGGASIEVDFSGSFLMFAVGNSAAENLIAITAAQEPHHCRSGTPRAAGPCQSAIRRGEPLGRRNEVRLCSADKPRR